MPHAIMLLHTRSPHEARSAMSQRTRSSDPDGRARRWYHLRPEPRRRTDFMGFNSTWWMALGWLVLLLVVAFPFPWVVVT